MESRFAALTHAAVAAAERGDTEELALLLDERDRLLDQMGTLPPAAEETQARLLDAARSTCAGMEAEMKELASRRQSARRLQSGSVGR